MKPLRQALDMAFENDLYFLILRAHGHTEDSIRRLDADEHAPPRSVLDDVDAAFDGCMRAICEQEDDLPDEPLPF